MKKKFKGFTLTELIVVIAIIGVLSAILGVAWMNYIANSRIKSQNSNSRIIFNAAQSIAQDYKFKERRMDVSDRDIGEGDFYFYWDSASGKVIDASGADLGGDAFFVQQFSENINKIFSGSSEAVYKIHIHDYIVKSVVSARNDSDTYKGSYPKKQDEREEGSVLSFDMTTIE